MAYSEIEKFVRDADTPVIYNVTMTNANEEYSQALPANTKKYMVHIRGEAYVLDLAFATGLVRPGTGVCLRIPIGCRYESPETLIETAPTVYVSCQTAAQVAEIEVWT